MSHHRTALWTAGLSLIASAGALAQPGSVPQATPSAAPASSPTPVASTPRQTLLRMQRPVTLDVKERRLEDVVRFMQQLTQADLEPLWAGDSGIGLDKERLITLKTTNQPALTVLEIILEKARTDAAQPANGWQMTDEGALEFGPKELLNRTRRLVTYDISDLLFVIPNYPEVPQVDLNSVLQQGKGGSGSSPFTGAGQNQALSPQQVEQRRLDSMKRIQDIITSTVEPEQWVDNGGDAATIRSWNTTFLVNAPDYVHRQINGYTYWPSSTPRVVNGRRSVTLNMDTGAAKIDGFAQSDVTAVVGGKPVSSNPGKNSPVPPAKKP